MNWYNFIKLAQIWDVNIYDEDNFEHMLVALYEMEFKYSTLLKKPFTGHPKRRENMLVKLKQNLTFVMKNVRDVLIKVYTKWLSSHAILDPKSWAIARLQSSYDFASKDLVSEVFREWEYLDPRIASIEHDVALRDILEEALTNKGKLPALNALLGYWIEERKDLMRTDLEDYGVENFNDSFSQNFQSPEQAEQYIDNITPDQIGGEAVEYISEISGELSEFDNLLYEFGLRDAVVIELYENLVFPAWYKKWKPQGIDETRENIENVSNKLEQIDFDNVQQAIVSINVAINAAHQTGEMVEYIEEHTGRDVMGTFEDLSSNNDYVNGWIEELQEVGVQVELV